MGGKYSGFQKQDNANSIQAEVEKCLQIFYKQPFSLTGSSRTDAGVHALQNYFHVDSEVNLEPANIYHLNSILPGDIVIKNILPVSPEAHCRFDAVSRNYRYIIYHAKNPFLEDRAFYFPYRVDIEMMQQAANCIMDFQDFTSFSKRNTQVNNFICSIHYSEWKTEGLTHVYEVRANRFLRGMVRGLVGTMLRVGTGRLTIDKFRTIIEMKDSAYADFSVPAHGLFLKEVCYINT